MKLKFWGVRGSIPTPGPQTVRYGGNTTCIQVLPSSGDLVILDAGTGIHALAKQLPKQLNRPVHILITHTHWDHIQGLPFFYPLFTAQNEIRIYGGQDPLTGCGIERSLSVQLQNSYFPISESQLKCRLHYRNLTAGIELRIGSLRIVPTILNHPVLNFGYRIDDDDGSSLFFTGDYEVPYNPYPPETVEYADFQRVVEQERQEAIKAMGGVDGLIIDSSYTDAEYSSKQGWGHGTYASSLRVARLAKVKKLFLTHHEPNRSDDELESIFAGLTNDSDTAGLQLYLAREGAEHSLC